jgi:hypothetical protein
MHMDTLFQVSFLHAQWVMFVLGTSAIEQVYSTEPAQWVCVVRNSSFDV